MSVANFFLDFWPVLLLVAVLAFGYVFIVLIPQIRENKVKAVYQHAGEPVLFWQTHELDETYLARFEREQMRYVSSGNRLALVQTPVIFFPMNCEFEFSWFGVVYRESTVGLSYRDYMAAGLRFYDKLKAIWDKETGAAHGTRQMMQMTRKQEILADDADIW